jgi:hypothetical protein
MTTYKVMEGGTCVDKGIASLDTAKEVAENYAREAGIDEGESIEIFDEDFDDSPVLTGTVTPSIAWGQPDWS